MVTRRLNSRLSMNQATMDDADVKSGSSPHYDSFYSPSNNLFYGSNQYPDLDTTKDEIRLITLLAGNKDEPLECYLISNLVLLGVKWTYKAISYCAGDPKNTTTILINEIPFNIFANLGDALPRIRAPRGTAAKEYRACMLWVD